MARRCLNKACEWHNAKSGGCRLFPGDFGLLTCRYADERTERPPKNNTRATNNKKETK